MRSLVLISALATGPNGLKRHRSRSPSLHPRAVDFETSTAAGASSTNQMVTATLTQLDPTADPSPTDLDTLGLPLDIITVTVTPTQAVTTITTSPTSVIDDNAVLVNAQNDYVAKRQEEGWKVAVIVVCTVGVFIMLTLFIIATRNQQRPNRNDSGSGEKRHRARLCFGGRRSDKSPDDPARRAPTPFRRCDQPGQSSEDRKGWELKGLWSPRSSNDPDSRVLLNLPPLAVRRTRATTIMSDTDTISPLNPKQHHRGIQASTTASTDVTRCCDPIPVTTQSTIVGPPEDEDSCTLRGASPAAKPAGISTLAHDNFRDFVFRGATATTATMEDDNHNNDASVLADESLYNEQGFYVSPRNPRTQSAPPYQPRNPARVSPGDVKRPVTSTAVGGFIFSNDELERQQQQQQQQQPRAAKRPRRSSDEHLAESQCDTDLLQSRDPKRSAQQAGNKSSIDVDGASRASAGLSMLSQPSRAPMPCPGCSVPDRTAPHGLVADDHDYATILAPSSRPATATGLHAAQAEAPKAARHRMTLD